jgi:hypothetical protein
MLVNGTYINSRACCCSVRLLYNTEHQARDSSAPECCSQAACSSPLHLFSCLKHSSTTQVGPMVKAYSRSHNNSHLIHDHLPQQEHLSAMAVLGIHVQAHSGRLQLFHPSTAIRSMWGSAQSYAHALCLVNFRKSSCRQQPQAAAELQLPDPVWSDMSMLPLECSSVMGVHICMMCCMSQHACTWLVGVVSVPIGCQIMVKADVNAELLSAAVILSMLVL